MAEILVKNTEISKLITVVETIFPTVSLKPIDDLTKKIKVVGNLTLSTDDFSLVVNIEDK